MPDPRAERSGVVGAPAPLAVVAELDSAEREAIELGDWLPDTFFRGELLNVQLWQWLALLMVLPLAVILPAPEMEEP